jgi:hypothetical protein
MFRRACSSTCSVLARIFSAGGERLGLGAAVILHGGADDAAGVGDEVVRL